MNAPFHRIGPDLESNWTDTRISRLKVLLHQGEPYAVIAREFGMSRNAISGKVNRLGLSKPMKPAANPARASAPRTRKWRAKTGLPPTGQTRLNRAIGPSSPFKHGPAAMPLQAPEKPAELIYSTPVDIWSLTEDTCRWPLGEPAHDMRYCGGMSLAGLPYCAAHCRMAYRPAGSRG